MKSLTSAARFAFCIITACFAVVAISEKANASNWQIEYWPNEVDGIGVLINNENVVGWDHAEGHVRKSYPKFSNYSKIHVYGAARPRGKNASMVVFCDGSVRQIMDFDNDEDHDVSCSRSAFKGDPNKEQCQGPSCALEIILHRCRQGHVSQADRAVFSKLPFEDQFFIRDLFPTLYSETANTDTVQRIKDR